MNFLPFHVYKRFYEIAAVVESESEALAAACLLKNSWKCVRILKGDKFFHVLVAGRRLGK